MKIAKDKVVLIHYTLKNVENELIDSSEGREPLAYVHGYNYLIEGLEAALEAKEVGAEFDLKLAIEDAYGDYDTELVYVVPTSDFEGQVEELTPGLQVEVNVGEDGEKAIALVTNVENNEVTLDLNHPLAGEELNFAVKVVDLRDATEAELEEGIVYGEKEEALS